LRTSRKKKTSHYSHTLQKIDGEKTPNCHPLPEKNKLATKYHNADSKRLAAWTKTLPQNTGKKTKKQNKTTPTTANQTVCEKQREPTKGEQKATPKPQAKVTQPK
jgi:hypothetical protein